MAINVLTGVNMKRWMGTALVLALVMLILAGCTGRRDRAGTQSAVITHWYYADNSDFSQIFQDIVAEFNATNGKGITVDAHEYPWEGGRYSENIFIAAMGGGGPDTATWKWTATPLFTANNLLANLDPFLNTWADREQIDDNLWDIMRYASGGSSIYVMPWVTVVLYVYYRPSMFRAAGIGVPQTYEEFLEACRLLTRGGVYGYGMRGSTGGHEPWGSFVHARGGNFDRFDSPEAIQGMQDFIDLFTNGYSPPTAPTDGFQQIIGGFRSGLTAMTIQHIVSHLEMVDSFGDDVDAFPFPRGVGQWTSFGDANNAMFEACRNKEAAFEWLAYLATGKGQETWCLSTGYIPVSRRVQQLPEIQNNRFMRASIAGAHYAGVFPILPTTTEWITTVWPNTVGAALMGRMSAEDAMRALQRSLHGD